MHGETLKFKNISSSKSSGHKNELMRALHQEHQVITYNKLRSVCLSERYN